MGAILRTVSVLGHYLQSAELAVRRAATALARPMSRVMLTAQAGRTRRHLAERRRSLTGAVARAAPVGPVDRSISVIVCTTGHQRTGLPVRAGSLVDVVSLGAHQPEGTTLAEKITHRAASLDSDLVCIVADTCEPMADDWLDRLAASLTDGVVAATPLFVHPERPLRRATPDDLLVRRSGLALSRRRGVPVAESVEAGQDADPTAAPRPVDAATAACLVVDRRRLLAAGGFPPHRDLDAAAVELCLHLRAEGGMVVAVPSAVVIDHRPVRSRQELRHPFDPHGPAWRGLVDRVGPLLLRPRRESGDPLSIAITIAAPTPRASPRWGDWHLARAFGRALERQGQVAHVQSLGEADDPASRVCDLQLVLRGKSPVRRTSGQRHALWVMSHPDTLTAGEVDEADLVLVASRSFARELRERTQTPVIDLLQATDPALFHPRTPDPAWAYPVAVVANARHVLRHGVADALTAGVRPAVIGRGWDRLIDPTLIVAQQVPNTELATVYSSVGVLLNDHWDDMRQRGFVSNRIFDALACATPLISDSMPELAELFGDAVATYESPEALRALVERDLGDPRAARRRAEAGRAEVLAHHTFDHRARQLLAALAGHGLDHPPAG